MITVSTYSPRDASEVLCSLYKPGIGIAVTSASYRDTKQVLEEFAKRTNLDLKYECDRVGVGDVVGLALCACRGQWIGREYIIVLEPDRIPPEQYVHLGLPLRRPTEAPVNLPPLARTGLPPLSLVGIGVDTLQTWSDRQPQNLQASKPCPNPPTT